MPQIDPSVPQPVFTITEKAPTSVLNVKALVGAFNQEKALVGAFSVIVKTGCGTDGSFYSTIVDPHVHTASASRG